jgi:hypothetical protein
MSYVNTATALLNLLKAKYKDGTVKSFYEGDPIQIPDAAYPAIIVEKISARVGVDASGMDKMIENLVIKIVMNKKEDLGQDDTVDMTERKLREFVEGRDDNGLYASNTILNLIRTMLTLEGRVVNNDTNISYDVIPLGGGRARSEADITVTLTERILVPNRT